MCRDHDQEASDPACQIVELMPILDAILRRLWGSYGNRPWRRQQIEDHFQSILLLLIEDNYRRLRTYDRSYSPIAWLRTITIHYLADYYRARLATEAWSEVFSDILREEAKQEEEMIYQERLEQLQETLGQLGDRERLLGKIFCSDLETEEIAWALGIEPPQVRKRKYELIKKVRKRLGAGGASAKEK